MTDFEENASKTRLEQTPYLIGWLARLEEQARKVLTSGKLSERDFAAQEEELKTVQSAQLRLGVRKEKGRRRQTKKENN